MMVAGLKGVQFRKMALNTTLYSTHTSDDERLKLKTYRAPWMAELPSKDSFTCFPVQGIPANPYGRPSLDSTCLAGWRTRLSHKRISLAVAFTPC